MPNRVLSSVAVAVSSVVVMSGLSGGVDVRTTDSGASELALQIQDPAHSGRPGAVRAFGQK
jgi:hypothetical protein